MSTQLKSGPQGGGEEAQEVTPMLMALAAGVAPIPPFISQLSPWKPDRQWHL